MIEYGVWSDAAGGFIETQLYSKDQVCDAITRWIDQGEDAEDLSGVILCPDHEEQPRNGCEECEAE